MEGDLESIIRIGTSGIVVPGAKNTFPKEFQSGSRLHYYSSLFNTIEINSTFYKIPLASTLKRWCAEAPEDFQFTVKLWRNITHAKRLLYNKDEIDLFMTTINSLEKKGCLLIQFPASITFDYFVKVKNILQRVNEFNEDRGWKIVVEFRSTSWYDSATYRMLDRSKASLVLHDIVASKTPLANPANSIIYIRFHGPTGNYRGSYGDEVLNRYAVYIRDWLKIQRPVYVYFNNTVGSAYQNAQLLKQLVNEAS